MNVIIFGYTTRIRNTETVNELVKEPTPPGNYKKPESIQKWQDENLPLIQAAWAKKAAYMKATGSLNSLFAVDTDSQHVFDSTEVEDVSHIGREFVKWLQGRGEIRTDITGPPPSNPVVFYGFNPKPMLRLAGMDAIRAEMDDVPIGLWYMNDNCFDPKEMLLETEAKDTVTLAKLCAEAPGGPISIPDGHVPHMDATVDAAVAVELCLRYQLIPELRKTTLTASLSDAIMPAPEDEEVEEVEEVEAPTKASTSKPAKKPRKAAAAAT